MHRKFAHIVAPFPPTSGFLNDDLLHTDDGMECQVQRF